MNAQDVTKQPESRPAVGCSRLVRPRAGQIWAYGGPNGRRDKIKSVSRGGAGKWVWDGKKLVPLGRSTAMWVKWESKLATITVKALLRDWAHVA